MTEVGRPDRSAEPSIVSARQDDLAAIMELEQTGFPAAERWSERSWRSELVADGRRVLTARADRLLGVISLQTGRESELLRLVVAPAARRQGVGAALVRAGVAAVGFDGARAVLLEVRWDNEAAIALYQRLGFEQLAARKNYYGPGVDALILKLWELGDLDKGWRDQIADEHADVPVGGRVDEAVGGGVGGRAPARSTEGER